MKRSVSALSVSLFAITLGTSAHASTKVTESYQLKNRGFSASFSSSDGCALSAMTVYFSEVVGDVNGVPLSDPPNTLVLLNYVDCNGHSFQLMGSTFQQQFTVANDLSSATLYAVVPVSTDEFAPVQVNTTVTLSLSFTATGPITTLNNQKEHSNAGGVKVKFSATSEGRPAQATGTATVDLPFSGGDDLPLIFAPSIEGSINRNTTGSLTVTKTKN
jgi:hypothetical protein